MWEEHRDDLLKKLEWKVANDSYHLKISNAHPSLWYIMKGKRQPRASPFDQPVPEEGRPPAEHWLKGERVGAVLIYVDDLLTSASRKVSEAMFKALGKHWELSSPE